MFYELELNTKITGIHILHFLLLKTNEDLKHMFCTMGGLKSLYEKIRPIVNIEGKKDCKDRYRNLFKNRYKHLIFK